MEHFRQTLGEEEIVIPDFDWLASNIEKYTEAQRKDAGSWQSKVKANALRPEVVQVDISKMNTGQAFAYSVVEEHFNKLTNGKDPPPLRAMVCGTAGAGKIFFIRAVK